MRLVLEAVLGPRRKGLDLIRSTLGLADHFPKAPDAAAFVAAAEF